MPLVVTTWFGAFLVDGGRVVKAYPAPRERAALGERLAMRRAGRVTPEESQLISDAEGAELRSRDRRLAPLGVATSTASEPTLDPREYGVDPTLHRSLLLDAATRDLTESWDPSLHVKEAVRAVEELEDIANRLEERLESWEEEPATDVTSPDPTRARGGATEPELLHGRQNVLALSEQVRSTARGLEKALELSMPRQAPNLCDLLGARLGARLISHAGGLERLARLPASTIQVLGAEKAFFEHLRGRAPPPRHGLLFLHPSLHSAPRAQRGRLARALAGKVAIAARLDRAGAALRPELRSAYEKRAASIKKQPRRSRGGPERSGAPLHRAAEDR